VNLLRHRLSFRGSASLCQHIPGDMFSSLIPSKWKRQVRVSKASSLHPCFTTFLFYFSLNSGPFPILSIVSCNGQVLIYFPEKKLHLFL